MQLNVIADQAAKERHSALSDATLVALQTKTPAQINAWVDANVTSLVQVRFVLKVILRLLVLLAKKL